jgi:uncharacterized Zn-finger protein
LLVLLFWRLSILLSVAFCIAFLYTEAEKMYDVECPYCGKDLEIDHDDGYGYEEGETYQQVCKYCEKTFVYTTSISFDYDVDQAECLNGGEHKWEKTPTYPYYFAKWRCEMCGDEKPLSDEDRDKAKQEWERKIEKNEMAQREALSDKLQGRPKIKLDKEEMGIPHLD